MAAVNRAPPGSIQTCKHNYVSVHVFHSHHTYSQLGFYLLEMSDDSVYESLTPRYLPSLRMSSPTQMGLCVLMKLDIEKSQGIIHHTRSHTPKCMYRLNFVLSLFSAHSVVVQSMAGTGIVLINVHPHLQLDQIKYVYTYIHVIVFVKVNSEIVCTMLSLQHTANVQYRQHLRITVVHWGPHLIPMTMKLCHRYSHKILQHTLFTCL